MSTDYRVRFSKNGPIKYTGHLDVMRYFQKAIVRSELPVAYSEGFSPHQILSFAFPLSVGFTSDGEYFDFRMTEEVNEEDVLNRLEKQMIDGINVISVKKLPENSENCMSSVFAAKYRIRIKDRVELPDDYIEKYNDYFGQFTIPVNKPKKKGGGFIEIDLKQFVYDYTIINKDLYLTVNASSSDNIRPDFLIKCYFDYMGIELPEFAYNVHRLDIYANKGSEDEIVLVSLGEA